MIVRSPDVFQKLGGRPSQLCSVSGVGAKWLISNSRSLKDSSPERIIADTIAHMEHELLINWFRIHMNWITKHNHDITGGFLSATTPFLPVRSNNFPLISDQVELMDKKSFFIPDGVFYLQSEKQNKALLFFLEADMSTESLTSSDDSSSTISKKLRDYHRYFQEGKYKRYEKKWNVPFEGFRLLLLTNNIQRKNSISRFIQGDPTNDFIWITDQGSLHTSGLSGRIWIRGGDTSKPQQSILGPTYATTCPLPILR